MFMAKELLKRIKREKALIVIQTLTRGWIARKNYNDTLNAALSIQRST